MRSTLSVDTAVTRRAKSNYILLSHCSIETNGHDYKVKTPSRSMHARGHHAKEVILIGCLREMSNIKKVGGRRLEESFNQALFFVSRFRKNGFTKRNENRA